MFLKKLVMVSVLALIAASAPSCESIVEVDNSAPRVTWVAVAPPVDGVADITVWISDIEGDPVSLELTWRSAGQSSAGTTIVQAPGGHGVVGLTTHLATQESNGQAHLIRWDVSEVSGQVELRFLPRDAEDAGVVVVSPAFDVVAGLPEAEQVVEAQ